jgi:hypothetical protein
MSFKPCEMPVRSSRSEILYLLEIESIKPGTSDPDDLSAYRRFLSNILKAANTKMAETSTKEHNYDEDEIKVYIDAILNNGFNLTETSLSDFPDFEDAQKLKRWSDLIGERIEDSEFNAQKFKPKPLRTLRSTIAQAKTLHELRQAVNGMIGPLQLWRDHQALLEATSLKQVALENKESMKYTESVLLELEDMTALAEERGRVINELLSFYSEDASDIALLRNCEIAKKEHSLSDQQTAKMFGISRTKLLKLRSEISISELQTA